jgi:hypothetical protein
MLDLRGVSMLFAWLCFGRVGWYGVSVSYPDVVWISLMFDLRGVSMLFACVCVFCCFSWMVWLFSHLLNDFFIHLRSFEGAVLGGGLTALPNFYNSIPIYACMDVIIHPIMHAFVIMIVYVHAYVRVIRFHILNSTASSASATFVELRLTCFDCQDLFDQTNLSKGYRPDLYLR